MSYNGWKNYETWVTALWIDNDQGTHEYAREILRENDGPAAAADALKDWVEEAFIDPITEGNSAGLAIDLLLAAFGSVDWYEIATSWLEDMEEEEETAEA